MRRELIVVAATYRLTELIVSDEITRPLRIKIGEWARDADEFSVQERIDYVVNCPVCTSIWAGTIVHALETFRVGRWVNGILAASAASLMWGAIGDRVSGEDG